METNLLPLNECVELTKYLKSINKEMKQTLKTLKEKNNEK